jgi:hypothetical protein
MGRRWEEFGITKVRNEWRNKSAWELKGLMEIWAGEAWGSRKRE